MLSMDLMLEHHATIALNVAIMIHTVNELSCAKKHNDSEYEAMVTMMHMAITLTSLSANTSIVMGPPNTIYHGGFDIGVIAPTATEHMSHISNQNPDATISLRVSISVMTSALMTMTINTRTKNDTHAIANPIVVVLESMYKFLYIFFLFFEVNKN